MDNTLKYIYDQLVDQTHQEYRNNSSVEIEPDETGLNITNILRDGTKSVSIRAQIEETNSRGLFEFIIVVIGTNQRREVFWPVKGTFSPRIRKAVKHIEHVVHKANSESLAIRQMYHKEIAKQEIGDIPSDLRLERVTDDYYELNLHREPMTTAQAKMLFTIIMDIRNGKH